MVSRAQTRWWQPRMHSCASACTTPSTLDMLARAAGVSKNHFAKRYKRATDTAPIQRFLRLKIERACHLLDVTHADIGDVAQQLGISDRYYFSRLFRSLVGVSPRGYRQLRRG